MAKWWVVEDGKVDCGLGGWTDDGVEMMMMMMIE